MINLFSYDILNNHVFYRGWHVLTYIEQNPDMSDLDKEAVCATIMDALVSNNLINPKEDALDFKTLAIVKSTNVKYYHYQKHPFVSGFPLWMKEKWRYKCMPAAGHLSAAIFISMLPGAQRCVYDLNNVASSIFKDFELSIAEYDSPTRPGIRAKERPFLKTNIDGVDYFIDTITKRIFNFEEFKRRYNLVLTDEVSLKTISKKKQRIYKYQVRHDPSRLGDCLLLMAPFIPSFKEVPKNAEYIYEFEKTKELYPEAWEEKEQREQEIAQMPPWDLSGLEKCREKIRKNF